MKHRASQRKDCPNCGTPVTPSQNFCPECGQENRELNLPVKHLLGEAVENVFHFDTKTLRSLSALLFKPGYLTLEFVRGKRAGYVPPVRLYVFISFIFFLLLQVPVTHEESGKPAFSLSMHGVESSELRGLRPAQIDSVLHARGLELSAMNRYMARQIERIDRSGIADFVHLIVKSLSYSMFVLMPVFALIVWLFFRKKAGYYIGTLIFSVHYHSFIFLLLTLCILLGKIGGWPYVLVLPFFLLPVYLFFALRKVYENSPLKTLGKVFAIGISQMVLTITVLWLTIFVNLIVY